MKTLKNAGFTLLEMAIVLAIIALVAGSSLALLLAQQDQRRIEDTQDMLNAAREALIGYALSHTAADGRAYLPCPDKMTAAGAGIANDGIEDRAASICVAAEGNLPWATLGLVPQTDAWSNRVRYRTSDNFSRSDMGFQLTFTGDINVLDAVAGNTLASNLPALILSHGKNGYGAINASGRANPAPPAQNTDEAANADGTVNFVSHAFAPAGAAGGEFDDQLTWISRYTLFNRMIQAGKLP